MSKSPEILQYKIDTICTAQFGPDGQVCRGYCARLKVLNGIREAQRVNEKQGFVSKEKPVIRVNGKCMREALETQALSGVLPRPDRLKKMRCGRRVSGEAHFHKKAKT